MELLPYLILFAPLALGALSLLVSFLVDEPLRKTCRRIALGAGILFVLVALYAIIVTLLSG
ncbi:hypothetical protein HUU05_06845 [candidate division KSB1 bacterium]|nr:hypothetical protein [candidate division KSB1 bacterium]